MPGGGASGDVTLPEYLIFQQASWLNGIEPFENGITYSMHTTPGWTGNYGTGLNVRDEMELAAAANPFTGVASYDPSSDLDEMDARGDQYTDAVDDIDAQQYLTDAIDAALAAADDQILNESYIAASVQAYEDSTNSRFLRSMGRTMSGFQAGRAVMSTHFDHARGDFELERNYDVGKYEADLRLNFQNQRVALAQRLAGQYVELIQLQLNALQNATALQIDLGKVRIAGKQDQINLDLKLDEYEALWRLDKFEYGAKMISAYSGGGVVPKNLTPGERVMQTILTAGTSAIAGGQALKSPAAGFAIGAITLAAGLLTGGL